MSLTSSRSSATRWAVLPAALVLAAGLSACSAANEQQGGQQGSAAAASGQNLSGNIRGAGASTQKVAQDAWIATFTGSNPQVTMSYDPIGSGGGRSNFISGAVAFAGTDAALDEEELPQAAARCGGQVVEFPAYISPIAITYNLPGLQQPLQLDAVTIANIFQGRIQTWNDPAIAQQNPGVALPPDRIVAVHRSDDSGTTENLTDYLNQAAPQAWTQEPDGAWPAGLAGEAAQGTSGVVNIIRSTPNSITYADESQTRGLQTVSVRVGQEYVGPSPDAAARILADSPQVPNTPPTVFAYELNRNTQAAGTYPVVLASYALACGRYPDAQTAQIAKAYLTYVTSQEGQQLAAQQAGSAPLSDQLRQQIAPAVNGITG